MIHTRSIRKEKLKPTTQSRNPKTFRLRQKPERNEKHGKKPSLYDWLAKEKGYTEADLIEMDFWPTWPEEVKKDVAEYHEKYKW